MQINTLTPEYSVTGQLQAADILEAAKLGFRTIINNRPDLEAADQPGSDQLRAVADEAGLTYHHLPIVPGEMTNAHISQLDQLLATAPTPVLAFCRTGTRSLMLWEQSNRSKAP